MPLTIWLTDFFYLGWHGGCWWRGPCLLHDADMGSSMNAGSSQDNVNKTKAWVVEFPIIALINGPIIWLILIYFPPTQTQVQHSFRRHFIQAHLVTQLGPFCSVIFRQGSKWNAYLVQTFMKMKVQYSPSIHLYRMSKSNTHLVFIYT